MKQVQNKWLVGLLTFFFIGAMLGVFQIPTTNQPGAQIPEPNTLRSCLVIQTVAQFAALNNTVGYTKEINIDPNPGQDFDGVTLVNFAHNQSTPQDFYIAEYPNTRITFINVSISKDFELAGSPTLTLNNVKVANNFRIAGSPTLTLNNVNISGRLFSTNYDIGKSIGSPTLSLMDVTASQGAQLRVTSGAITVINHNIPVLTIDNFTTCAINGSSMASGTVTVVGDTQVSVFNSDIGTLEVDGTSPVTINDSDIGTIEVDRTSPVTINDSDIGTLQVDGNAPVSVFDSDIGTFQVDGKAPVTITGATITTLGVGGAAIVSISNSDITSIVESVSPTVTSYSATYPDTYTFLFETNIQVDIQWNASDNIRGLGYELNYSVTIWKDDQLVDTINQSTTSASVSVDTGAKIEIKIQCIDQQGNIATVTIPISPTANILMFVIMIVAIAGGVIGAILIYHFWKQRQWQKTPVMEIPVG